MNDQERIKIEHLGYTPGRRSFLRLIGDVTTILDSRCTRESLYCLTSPPYALGGAAVSTTAEQALKHLGEFLCIDSRPVWTPSGTYSCAPLIGTKEATIYTPFLVEWDGKINVTFAFRSQTGLSMPSLYRKVFEETRKLDKDLNSPLIATIIIAEAMTNRIIDKVMSISPTRSNAPSNGRQITHKMNINRYFEWNITRKRRLEVSREDQLELLLIIGIGVDMSHNNLTNDNLTRLLPRAFYITPGMKLGSELIHNHAVILSQSKPSFSSLYDQLRKSNTDLCEIGGQLLEQPCSSDVLCMVHIENDTVLNRGLIGVGIISQIDVSS